MNAKKGVPAQKDTSTSKVVVEPINNTRKNNKRLSLALIEDKINVVQQSLSQLRAEIRYIVRDEIKNIEKKLSINGDTFNQLIKFKMSNKCNCWVCSIFN